MGSAFFEKLSYLLEYVKDYVGFRHSLMVKLCRIFKSIQKNVPIINKESQKEICSDSIKFIIKNYIVPGIGYELYNPSLGNEVFSLL